MTLFSVLMLSMLFTASVQFTGDKKNKTYDLKLAPKLFKSFETYYRKKYTLKERERRSKVFYDNLVRINAINQNFPGNWLAVIGPYADLTYLEFVKLFGFTKEHYTNIGNKYRNVINCTKRRAYIFERFSEKVKNEYDNTMPEYYSDENETSTDHHKNDDDDDDYSDENDTSLAAPETDHDSDKNETTTLKDQTAMDMRS